MRDGVKIKFIETPPFLSFDEQVRFINMWINDMQRNNIVVLSNNPHNQAHIDGTFTVGFIIEYRDELDDNIGVELSSQ